MKYPIKLAIFDLDGTLADTIYDIADSLHQLFLKYGDYPADPEMPRQCIGNGVALLIERMCGRLGIVQEDKEKDIQEFKAIYAGNPCHGTKVYPGVIPVLDRLKQNGAKIAVATMKPKKATQTCLKATGLAKYMDKVLSFEDMEKPKPDGWCVKECMKEFGIAPEETMMIGDGMTDILAGLDAGVVTMALLGGYYDQEKIKASNATHILSNMSELLDWIE